VGRMLWGRAWRGRFLHRGQRCGVRDERDDAHRGRTGPGAEDRRRLDACATGDAGGCAAIAAGMLVRRGWRGMRELQEEGCEGSAAAQGCGGSSGASRGASTEATSARSASASSAEAWDTKAGRSQTGSCAAGCAWEEWQSADHNSRTEARCSCAKTGCSCAEACGYSAKSRFRSGKGRGSRQRNAGGSGDCEPRAGDAGPAA